MLLGKNTIFKAGDRFYLKYEPNRCGEIIRIARDTEFGCDLAVWSFNYYVVKMDNKGIAPIQTNHGGIAEESDMVKIII